MLKFCNLIIGTLNHSTNKNQSCLIYLVTCPSKFQIEYMILLFLYTAYQLGTLIINPLIIIMLCFPLNFTTAMFLCLFRKFLPHHKCQLFRCIILPQLIHSFTLKSNSFL